MYHPDQEFEMLARLAALFENISDALCFLPNSSNKYQMSMLEKAACFRMIIEQPYFTNPAAKPIGFTYQGESVYSDRAIKGALGMTDVEVGLVLDTMLEQQLSPSNCWC